MNIIVKTDGSEALYYLKNKSSDLLPNLIFLDINMPVMNGWEFLDAYEELSDDLKAEVVVMMLTTSSNPDDASKAKEYEVLQDFMTKPLSPEVLLKVIKRYLNH